MKNKWSIGGYEIDSDESFVIKKIQMSQLVSYLNIGKIIIPEFQREIDAEKIKKIYKLQVKKNKINNNWLIQQGPLSLCLIGDSTDKIYLIDGQHRLRAMERLVKKNKLTNECIIIQIKKCTTLNDMKEYFKHLNINSNIEIQYKHLENEFYLSLVEKLKKEIKILYPNGFSRNKNSNKLNQFLHIDQFIEKFNYNKLKTSKYWDEKIKKLNIDLILESILKINLIIEKKYNNIDDIDNYLYKKTQNKLEESGFYLSVTNVNWFNNFINDEDEIIIKPQKIKKKAIPKKIKTKIWEKRFNTSAKGFCICCSSELDKTEFHAGHILSEFNGGLIEVDNLEPICSQCNASMQTMRMDDYIKKYYPQNLQYLNNQILVKIAS